VYVASKHAVERLTKAAALEVAESAARINVAPGPANTSEQVRSELLHRSSSGSIYDRPHSRQFFWLDT
jgi:NAD(P)-dependent dehydrogenase (short-subunit alcohol dehydrogenase family)